MQHRVEQELADADAVLFVVDAEQGVGPGDRFIARALLGAGAGPPSCARSTRSTALASRRSPKTLVEVEELEVADEIFP